MSVAFDSNVTVTVEIGFGASGPFDSTITWTDVSADVRGFNIDRGKVIGHENGVYDSGNAGLVPKFRSSKLSLRLDNTSGDYDPMYTLGGNYPNVVPGTPCRVKATYSSTDYWLFSGHIDMWPVQWQNKNSEVVAEGLDGLAILNRTRVSTDESAENSGTRVGNILDNGNWPSGAGNRNIAAGNYTMNVPPSGGQECVSCLAQIMDVVDSENGLFWVAPSGNGIGEAVFKGNGYRAGLTSSATFGSGAGEIPFMDDIKITLDNWQVVNDYIGLPNEPGYESGIDSATANDSASQTGNGIFTGIVSGGLWNSQSDANTVAGNYVATYKDPEVTVKEMRVQPRRSPSDWGTLLGLDLNDQITVKVRPDTYSATHTLTQYIEAIKMDADADSRSWIITFGCSPYA
jgi:hypothetical protein